MEQLKPLSDRELREELIEYILGKNWQYVSKEFIKI